MTNLNDKIIKFDIVKKKDMSAFMCLKFPLLWRVGKLSFSQIYSGKLSLIRWMTDAKSPCIDATTDSVSKFQV